MNIELIKQKKEESDKLTREWIDTVIKIVIEDLSGDRLAKKVDKVLASGCLDYRENANVNARLFVSAYLESLSCMYEPNLGKQQRKKLLEVRTKL